MLTKGQDIPIDKDLGGEILGFREREWEEKISPRYDDITC